MVGEFNATIIISSELNIKAIDVTIYTKVCGYIFLLITTVSIYVSKYIQI